MNVMKNIVSNHRIVIHTLSMVVLLSAVTITSDARAEAWEKSIGVSLGQFQGDKSSWSIPDEFGSIGFSLEMKKPSWPVSLTLDLMGAGDDRTTATSSAEDTLGNILLGLKKSWQLGNSSFKPYVGAGLNYAVAEKTFNAPGIYRKQHDKDLSYYVGAGLQWQFSDAYSLSIESRYIDADVTIFNKAVDAGGVNTSLRFDYHF